MKIIKNPNIQFVQDYGDGIICDLIIDKEKNPDMFNKQGKFIKFKLDQLEVFNKGKEIQEKIK